ncbi:MAG: adenylate/guanylate cyclase domain-containing protein [Mariprofundaceae bacterium]|nr:adenylate/guanylate cyclase domain-containing protein [Mariprofundaceae bacterium]
MGIKKSQFRKKIHLVLALLGVLPYLLTAYIFMQAGLGITQSLLFMSAMVLVFHLAGFQILRTFSDELLDLVHSSTVIKGGGYAALKISEGSTTEVTSIRRNFNALLFDLEKLQNKFEMVTIQLLQESRKSHLEYERRLTELEPYVDPKVFKRITDNKVEKNASLNCEHRRVAVLFLDICSFTKMSEYLPPEDVGQMLNDFFTVAVQVIYRHNGMVDKFIGDAVMAVFGLTTPLHQVSVDAVNAALDLQEATHDLMQKWKRQGRLTFRVRVGVNTGEVIAGNIGSRDRMDYTVIGDPVNAASRVVDQAGADEVVISGTTYESCKRYFDTEFKGAVRVKNRLVPIDCYKVIQKKGAKSLEMTPDFNESACIHPIEVNQ